MKNTCNAAISANMTQNTIILIYDSIALVFCMHEISLTNAQHGSWTTWLNSQACLDKFGLALVCSPSWGCSGCWLISRDLAKDRYNNIPSLSTKSRAPNLPTASECWANREEYVVLTANRNSGLYINRTDCQITECVLFWGALGLVSDLFVHEDKQLEINERCLECVSAWAHGQLRSTVVILRNERFTKRRAKVKGKGCWSQPLPACPELNLISFSYFFFHFPQYYSFLYLPISHQVYSCLGAMDVHTCPFSMFIHLSK